MKQKKIVSLILLLGMVFTLTIFSWEKVVASEKTTSITKTLVYQKPLDISLGKGGVYFPSSNYTGSAVLTRLEPVDTKQIRFSQRWIDIHLYDKSGKEFKNVYGYVYVYFNLNVEDRAAWNKGNLSIYHYNEVKKIWEESETQLLTNKNVPYGRVKVLVQEFGLFGLGTTR